MEQKFIHDLIFPRVNLVYEKMEDFLTEETRTLNTVENLKYELEKLKENQAKTTNSMNVLQHLIAIQPEGTLREAVSVEFDLDSFPTTAETGDQPEHLETQGREVKFTSETPEQVDEPKPFILNRMASIQQAYARKKQFSESYPPSTSPTTKDSVLAEPPSPGKNRGRSMTELEPKEVMDQDRNMERSTSFVSRGRRAKVNKPLPESPRRLLKYNRSDYTSITDDLETVAKLTPHPALSRMASQATDSEHEQAIAMEIAILHGAEEADYHLMEGLIQRRLRRDSENLALSLEELCSIQSLECDDQSVDDESEQASEHQRTPPIITRTEVSDTNQEDNEENPTASTSNLLFPNWTESKF